MPVRARGQRDGGLCKGCSKKSVIILAVVITILLVIIISVAVHSSLKSTEDEVLSARSPLGVYKNAAVASDNYDCSRIGTDILERGGSAVDSAIASLLCDGIHNMHSMGIGGGFFMTIYTRETKESLTIDARESAPQASTRDMYVNKTAESMHGGLAIAVPGEMRGYAEAHRRFGKLPWKELFTPAIKMCRDGFKISKTLAVAIELAANPNFPCLQNETWRLREILRKNSKGDLYEEGDNLKLPILANTLERIATVGAEDLYTGRLATTLIDDARLVGSILTLEDLSSYEVKVKRPSQIKLNGGILYTLPPPSNGPILQLILNILEGFQLTAMDMESKEATALTYHRVIEAFKLAYGRRRELGDEDFVDTKALVGKLTSESYADKLRLQIWDNTTHNASYYGRLFEPDKERGTVHISVLAANGDAVSVTSTLNWYFGSCVRSPHTGIILNNEMADFSSPGSGIARNNRFPPAPTNFVVPGKRPMSSMCPAVLVDENGDVRVVIGGSGGSRITTATAWALIHHLWLGMTINEAIDVPRLHHQLIPNYIKHELTFDTVLKDILHSKYGHDIRPRTRYDGSVVQGISVEDGFVYACADHRKYGGVDGY